MVKRSLLYIPPLLALTFFIILQWYGFLHNAFVEIMFASFLVAFYFYVNILAGFAAFFVFSIWILFKYFILQTDYKISELNKASIRGNIPHNIIQMWVGPVQALSKYKSYIQSVKSLNPDCQYMFFDKDDIDYFFKNHYPEYFKTYNSLPLLIQRLDFFRYLAIYHYGGIYLDLDIKALKPFDSSFFNHSSVFPVDEYLSDNLIHVPRFEPFLKKGCRFLLGQYGFGAEKKHPFLMYLVESIHSNVHKIVEEYKRNPMKKRAKEWFVYKTTGPDYVTDIYMEYGNKNSITILDNGKRQYFGNYAKHNYFGTWK